MSLRALRVGLCLAAALTVAPSVYATTLIHMNLKDLATRADRVFRGTVIAVDTGTVRAGGSDLPTVTYKLRVDETFKGEPSVVKDDTAYMEIRMVGTKTEGAVVNGRRHFSIFRDVPRLEMGADYVLFTTRPSAHRPLHHGRPRPGRVPIADAGKEEQAVNAFGNAGLARGLSASAPARRGPVSYAQLAAAIRAVLGE